MLTFTFAYDFVVSVVRALDDTDHFRDFLSSSERELVHKMARPHRVTLLHDFVRSVNEFEYDYLTGKWDEEQAPHFRQLLESAGLTAPTWLADGGLPPDQKSIYSLDELVRRATPLFTDAAFHVLFADRGFLHRFQRRIADEVRSTRHDEYPSLFRALGRLKRVALPPWARNAVASRDRCCQECLRVLWTDGISMSDLRFDHMVPLALGGSNDPTNFQLLCANCNADKSASQRFKRNATHTWW